MRIQAFILRACFLCAIPIAAHATTNDIQMMPPTDFGSMTGTCSSSGVLFWDNLTPIHCIPGVTGDAVGDLTIGTGALTAKNSFSVTGGTTTDTLKFLSGGTTTDVTSTVINLTKLGACPASEALTATGGGTFTCIAVANIPHIGTSIVPSCPATQQIYFDPVNGFTCTALPTTPTPPTCTGNNVLHFDGTRFTCDAMAVPPPVVSANPLYIASYAYTDPGAWNNDILAGIIAIWRAAPGTGNINSENSWNECKITDPNSDAQISGINLNIDCMVLSCTGHFGKYPTLAQSNGMCAAGDSNPNCNGMAGTGVHMDLNINCEYAQ